MMLFIVSGISSRLYLEKHTDKEFVKSRTVKLLVPSTIGLFVFQFIQGYISMSLSNAFDDLKEVPAIIKYLIMVLSGSGVLWYVQMLWLFSVMLTGQSTVRCCLQATAGLALLPCWEDLLKTLILKMALRGG